MSETVSKPNRIRTPDFFKGFAIISVVLVHLFILVPRVKETADSNVILEFFYAGLLTFFIIAGYFYRPKTPKQVVSRIIKLLVAVLLCKVILTTLLYWYLLGVGYDLPSDAFVQTLVSELTFGGNLFQEPSVFGAANDSPCVIYAGYYFVEVLAISTAVFYLVIDWVLRCNKNLVIALATCVIASAVYFGFVNVTLPFYMQLVPIALSMMFFGAYLGKRKTIETMEANWRDYGTLLTLLGCIVVAVFLLFMFPTGLKFNTSYFGEYGGWSSISIFFIGITCGFIQLYICSLFCKIRYLSDFFVRVGKHTLAILLLSTFYSKVVIAPFFDIPWEFTFPKMPLTTIFLVAALSITLSIITEYIVRMVISKAKEERAKNPPAHS